MAPELLAQKITKISKETGIGKWVQIVTLVAALGSGMAWLFEGRQTQVVDNTELRAMIKQLNADLTAKMELTNSQTNNHIEANGFKDSVRNMELRNQINLGGVITGNRIQGIDDRLKHLEYLPVTEKRTSAGLIVVPVR